MDILGSMAALPWLWFIIVCAIYYAFKFTLRSINIAIRGWPPAHLDADGDFKKESEE
jgi:hypothetical protein